SLLPWGRPRFPADGRCAKEGQEEDARIIVAEQSHACIMTEFMDQDGNEDRGGCDRRPACAHDHDREQERNARPNPASQAALRASEQTIPKAANTIYESAAVSRFLVGIWGPAKKNRARLLKENLGVPGGKGEFLFRRRKCQTLRADRAATNDA